MALKKTFVFLCLFSFGLAFAAAGSEVVAAAADLCGSLRGLLPILAMLMIVLAGAIYAAGQLMGAETRARANVWATASLTGALISVLISAIGPSFVGVIYPGVDCAVIAPQGGGGGGVQCGAVGQACCAGNVCNSGTCQGGTCVQVAQACAAGQYSCNGGCIPLAQQCNGACDAGYSACGATCIPAGTNCCAGQPDPQNLCCNGAFCLEGQECRLVGGANTCVNLNVVLGGACNELNICTAGLDCIGSHCTQQNVPQGGTCGQYQLCTSGLDCVAGKCKLTCINPPGVCTANADCCNYPATNSCIRGACAAKSVAGGPCDENSDCLNAGATCVFNKGLGTCSK